MLHLNVIEYFLNSSNIIDPKKGNTFAAGQCVLQNVQDCYLSEETSTNTKISSPCDCDWLNRSFNAI